MVKLFGDGDVVRSVDVEPVVVEPVAANDAPLVVVEPVVVAPSSVEPVRHPPRVGGVITRSEPRQTPSRSPREPNASSLPA